MYVATRRTHSGRLQVFDRTPALAVAAFIETHGILPAVVYAPDGSPEVRLIQCPERPGRGPRYEPAGPPGTGLTRPETPS